MRGSQNYRNTEDGTLADIRLADTALAGLLELRRQTGGEILSPPVKTGSRRPCRRACRRRPSLARARARGAEVVVGGAEVAASLPCPVEHGEVRVEVLQHHLGGVLVLAGLVLPLARLQLALEIDLRALLQILLRDPAKTFVEDHDAVPFGLFLAFAGGLVAPGFRRGHAQIRDRPTILRAPDLRVLPEIADEDHLVDRTCHDRLLLSPEYVRHENPCHNYELTSPLRPGPSCFSTSRAIRKCVRHLVLFLF